MHASKLSILKFAIILLLAASSGGHPIRALADDQTVFMRIPTQYIAALGAPDATSGSGAETWGIWRRDPGPRGVWLQNFSDLQKAGGVAPAKWKFDQSDWWLDEHGILMEKPDFPVPPGKYVVTGDREAVSILTIHESDAEGNRRWELRDGTKLHDVTHLPCRSARYTPMPGTQICSPAVAPLDAFSVKPGAEMPSVKGCQKQDYSVLFVIAVAVKR